MDRKAYAIQALEAIKKDVIDSTRMLYDKRDVIEMLNNMTERILFNERKERTKKSH